MDMNSNANNSTAAAASAPINNQQVTSDDQLLALIQLCLLAASLPCTDRSMLIFYVLRSVDVSFSLALLLL
jgi:hypothetical protein